LHISVLTKSALIPCHSGQAFCHTGEPRNATVRAEVDTLVLEIRKKDLSPLIAANPELAGRLADLLQHRQGEWDVAISISPDEGSSEKSESSRRRTLIDRIRLFFSIDRAG